MVRVLSISCTLEAFADIKEVIDASYSADRPNGVGLKNEVKVAGGWLDPPGPPWGQDHDDMEDLDKAADEDPSNRPLGMSDDGPSHGVQAGARRAGEHTDKPANASKEDNNETVDPLNETRDAQNDEEVGPFNETRDQGEDQEVGISDETSDDTDKEDVDPSIEMSKELTNLAQRSYDIVKSIENSGDKHEESSSHEKAEAIAQWANMSTGASKRAENPPITQADDVYKPTSTDRDLMGLLDDMDNGTKASHQPDALRPWSKQDKEDLFDWIHEHSVTDWPLIASWAMRTEEQCQAMYRQIAHLNVEQPSENIWTTMEDADLMRWVDHYHVDDWMRIAFHMQRTYVDCQRRYEELKAAALQDPASKDPIARTSDDNARAINVSSETEEEGRHPSEEPKTTAHPMRPTLALTIPEGATPGENNQYRGQKRVRALKCGADEEEAERNPKKRAGVLITAGRDRPRHGLKRARFIEPNDEIARPTKARRTGETVFVSAPRDNVEAAKDHSGRSRMRARIIGPDDAIARPSRARRTKDTVLVPAPLDNVEAAKKYSGRSRMRARIIGPNDTIPRPTKARRTKKTALVPAPLDKVEAAKDHSRSRKRARDTETNDEDEEDGKSGGPRRFQRIASRIASQDVQLATQSAPSTEKTHEQKVRGRKRAREVDEDVEAEQDISTPRSKRTKRAPVPRTRKRVNLPVQQAPLASPAKPQANGRVLRSSSRIAKAKAKSAKAKSDDDNVDHSGTTKAFPKVANCGKRAKSKRQAMDSLRQEKSKETSQELVGEATRGRRKATARSVLEGPNPRRAKSHASKSDKDLDKGPFDEKGHSKSDGARRFGEDRGAGRYNLRQRPAR